MANYDTATNLFEHIKNRLPSGFGLGDDGTTVTGGVPDHKTFQQSLREDHEGDVGIFELQCAEIKLLAGACGYKSQVQIAVVTKNGDIDSALKYLRGAFNNIKTNRQSSGVYVKDVDIVNLMPIGKNGSGLQMATLYIALSYALV